MSLHLRCFYVNVSVCLVCCVSDSVCEYLWVWLLFLLLNVMEVGGSALLDRHCMVF